MTRCLSFIMILPLDYQTSPLCFPFYDDFFPYLLLQNYIICGKGLRLPPGLTVHHGNSLPNSCSLQVQYQNYLDHKLRLDDVLYGRFDRVVVQVSSVNYYYDVFPVHKLNMHSKDCLEVDRQVIQLLKNIFCLSFLRFNKLLERYLRGKRICIYNMVIFQAEYARLIFPCVIGIVGSKNQR